MNTRMLNVQQPWSWALVNGYKDVENRSRHLPGTMQLPMWVIIVASKTKPTKKTMLDFHQKIKAARVNVPTIEDFTTGAIMGMVRFDSSQNHSESIWFNGSPNKAWIVGDSYALNDPILNIRGSLTPNRLLRTHPQQKEIWTSLNTQLTPSQLTLLHT